MNPEFRRHLWLECSVHRIGVTLAALLAVFILAGLFDPRGLGRVVANVALMCFAVVTIAWGAHLAGEAMLDELRDRTWDSQRMSALAPWPMTWGKLFGGPIIAWIAGLVCLQVYALCAYRGGVDKVFTTALLCVAGAVLIQGMSLIGALAVARRSKRVKAAVGSRVAAVLVASVSIYFAVVTRGEALITWYGTAYSKLEFLAVALSVFAAWAIFGAFRMMCEELQVPTVPWAWSAFLGYSGLFLAGGFIDPAWPPARALGLLAAMGLTVFVVGLYLSAFALYRDPLSMRRLLRYARARNWRRFWEETPLWLAAFYGAAACAIACSALAFTPHTSDARIENVDFAALPILLYAVRDLLILFSLSFGAKSERAEVGTIIYLALLYWLIPAILETAGLVGLAGLVRPPLWDHPFRSAAIIATQAIVCGVLAWRRYRTYAAPRIASA